MSKTVTPKTRVFTLTLTFVCQMLVVALVGVMFVNVFLRFGFDAGSIKFQDLQSYIFAVLIPLSVAFAVLGNKHIRAGAAHEKDTGFKQSRFVGWLEFILGLISFGAILAYSLPGVAASWVIFEGSTELGGLSGYFLVRTTIPVMCLIAIVAICRRHLSCNRGGI